MNEHSVVQNAKGKFRVPFGIGPFLCDTHFNPKFQFDWWYVFIQVMRKVWINDLNIKFQMDKVDDSAKWSLTTELII